VTILSRLLRRCRAWRSDAGVEVAYCKDIRAWRLTTPQVSLLREIDEEGDFSHAPEAFDAALDAARAAGDQVIFDALLELRRTLNELSDGAAG
jgi:hypothetical protein